ncbi:hypothetical protein NMY22_g14277 [Coprinellus aureogranulatus]|nr:hypothetical protein NMY22_g14277 [Coprinellus aureogranulatus]
MVSRYLLKKFVARATKEYHSTSNPTRTTRLQASEMRDTPCTTGSQAGGTSNTLPGAEVLVTRLAQAAMSAMSASQYQKIVATFNVVAMNIAAMRLGQLEFEVPDEVPDGRLAYMFRELKAMMTSTAAKPHHFRRPLLLGLMVSSLVWLIPRNYASTRSDLGDEDMILAFKANGNQTPEVIQQFEFPLWRIVFRAACGFESVESGLLALYEDWKGKDWKAELGDLAGYFSGGQETLTGKIDLLGADVIGSWPSTWPTPQAPMKPLRLPLLSDDLPDRQIHPSQTQQCFQLSSESTVPTPLLTNNSTRAPTATPFMSSAFIPMPPESRHSSTAPQRVRSGTQLPLSDTSESSSQATGLSPSLIHLNSLPTSNRDPVPRAPDPCADVSRAHGLVHTQWHQDVHLPVPPNASSSSNIVAPPMPVVLAPSLPIVPAAASRPPVTPSTLAVPEPPTELSKPPKPPTNVRPKRTRRKAQPFDFSLYLTSKSGSGLKANVGKKAKGNHKKKGGEMAKFKHVIDVDALKTRLKDEATRNSIDVGMVVKPEAYHATVPPLKLEYRDRSRPAPSVVVLYDAEGNVHRWDLSIHTSEDAKVLRAFLDAIQLDYVDKLPRFLIDKQAEHRVGVKRQSAFHVLEWTVFKVMSAREVQQILSRQSILLIHCPTEGYDIQESLDMLGPPELRIEVQDQSISVTKGNYQKTVRSACLSDLMAAVTSSSECKPLNGLSFARVVADVPISSYASEARAFQQTTSEPFCEDMWLAALRWFIAATKGAHHYWHIDANGFATVIQLLCGKKLWVVARPKNFSMPPPAEFDVANPNTDLWDIEATVLTPTIRLIQDPDRWHAAWTIEHAVCSGEHFLPVGALEKVSVGVMQTFLRGSVVTNTEHAEVWPLLQRLVIYFHRIFVKDVRRTNRGTYPRFCARASVDPFTDEGHYPDLQDLQSVRGLLSLLVVVELHNVLCQSSYESPDPSQYPSLPASQLLPKFDINSLTEAQRQLRIYARGVGFDLLQWISCHYRFANPHTAEVKHMWRDIYLPILAWTIFALKKSFPVPQPRTGRPKRANHLPEPTDSDAFIPTHEIFLQQVHWSLDAFPGLREAFEQMEEENVEVSHLIWPGWILSSDQGSTLTITPNPTPFPHTAKDQEQLFVSGIRDGDRFHSLMLSAEDCPSSKRGGPVEAPGTPPFVACDGQYTHEFIPRSTQ